MMMMRGGNGGNLNSVNGNNLYEIGGSFIGMDPSSDGGNYNQNG